MSGIIPPLLARSLPLPPAINWPALWQLLQPQGVVATSLPPPPYNIFPCIVAPAFPTRRFAGGVANDQATMLALIPGAIADSFVNAALIYPALPP